MRKTNTTPQQKFENYKLRTGFEEIDPWRGIFNVAKEDSDLIICARGNQYHIYYRGGKILEVNPQSLKFDLKYLKRKKDGFIPSEFSAFLSSKDSLDKIKDCSEEEIGLDIEILKNDARGYFNAAKKVMNGWFDENEKQEREDQQEIAKIGNTSERNLAVIDIEFAVSFNANYYNRKYMDDEKKDQSTKYQRYPNPRFDIIAVDNNGQVHVIELKTGLEALNNAKKHVTDFLEMIGSHDIGDNKPIRKVRYKSFLEEIDAMVKVLNEKKLRKVDLPNIDTNKPPLFHFAFTPKNYESKGPSKEYQIKNFPKKIKEALIDGVDIVNVDEKFILSLNK